MHRDILVFVPAYEGSQLWDQNLAGATSADPICVWGNANVFFSSQRYFSLRMPNPLEARLMRRVGPVDVYGKFIDDMLRRHDDAPAFAPYTLGADFFVFSYDWRQEIASVSAPQFEQAMDMYAKIHEARTGIAQSRVHFTIVTHSMGGLVARTWLSENPSWAKRIDRMYLVGAPNRGSVKAARTVVVGPASLTSEAHGFPGILLNLIPTDVDQRVTKLVGITRPTLYELLPYDDPGWLESQATGDQRKVSADELLEVETWRRFWPSAALEKRLFIDSWLKKRLAENRKPLQPPARWEYCQDPSLPQLKVMLKAVADWRLRQGTLQHTANLLTDAGKPTRLRIIYSTGIKTPSGFVSHGEHDAATADYLYTHGNDGDGTMEAPSVLDGFSPTDPNIKTLQGVPHGQLMISPEFLHYFNKELADRQTAVANPF